MFLLQVVAKEAELDRIESERKKWVSKPRSQFWSLLDPIWAYVQQNQICWVWEKMCIEAKWEFQMTTECCKCLDDLSRETIRRLQKFIEEYLIQKEELDRAAVSRESATLMFNLIKTRFNWEQTSRQLLSLRFFACSALLGMVSYFNRLPLRRQSSTLFSHLTLCVDLTESSKTTRWKETSWLSSWSWGSTTPDWWKKNGLRKHSKTSNCEEPWP